MSAVITAVVVGTAVSIYGAVQADKNYDAAAAQSREVAEAQAREFRRGAQNEREIGRFEAGQIRRKAIENRSTQIAYAAHNGIIVGDGTSAGMAAKTMRLAKQDMIVTMYNSERVAQNLELKAEDAEKSGLVQASVYKAEGSAAMTKGLASAAFGVGQIITAIQGRKTPPTPPPTPPPALNT